MVAVPWSFHLKTPMASPTPRHTVSPRRMGLACGIALFAGGFNPSRRYWKIGHTYPKQKQQPVWTTYIPSYFMHRFITIWSCLIPRKQGLLGAPNPCNMCFGWTQGNLWTCFLDEESGRFGGELQKKLLARQLWWTCWFTSIKTSCPLGSKNLLG